MKVLNLTKNTVCVRHLQKAQSFSARLTGMIGKDFSHFDGMLFDRCNAVHTFFMKIPLDILFVSREGEVLKRVENFPPWKPFCGCKNSFYVIELEGGSLTRSGTEEGDQLSFGNGTGNGSTL